MLGLNDAQLVAGILGTYKISDQDDADANTTYFGFVNNQQDWYLMKQVASGTETSYRYYKGSGGYSAAWTAHASTTYDYYFNIFK